MRLLSGPGELEVLEVEAGDAGIYECVVDTGGEPLIQTHQLIISSPAVISWCGEVVRTAPGSTSVLQCLVSGHPQPAVSWSRQGVNLDLERGRNSTWLLDSVRREEEGLYTCRATNAAGRAECQTTVVVEEPPVVSIQDTWTVYPS